MTSPFQSEDEAAPERLHTLPSIRDVFRDELSQSPMPRTKPLDRSFSLTPLHSALNDDDDLRYSQTRSSSRSPALHSIDRHQVTGHSARTPSTGGSLGHYPRTEFNLPTPSLYSTSQPSTASSYSMETPPPITQSVSSVRDSYRRDHDHRSPRRSSVASTSSGYSDHVNSAHRSKSFSFSGRAPNQSISNLRPSPHGYESTLMHTPDWYGRERRESFGRESPRSTRDVSQYDAPSPPQNALQFQPFNHAHYSSPFTQSPMNSAYRRDGDSADYASPFGVLIADSAVAGVPPADPQRIAILRGVIPSPHMNFVGTSEESGSDSRKSTPVAKYECPYCAKRFNRPSSLKIHINTHTGEKPFQCPHPGCGRCFSVQSNMRRHARIHGQGSQQQQESSGDEVSEEGSQGLPSQDVTTTQESTPLLIALGTEDSQIHHGQSVPRGRSVSRSQHGRSYSMDDEIIMKPKGSKRRSRHSSPEEDERPGKRSRLSAPDLHPS